MANLPFGFDVPEDSPGFLLWQATMTWQRLIRKALDPYNISHAQFVILACLLWLENQEERPTQIHLVKMTKLDKMTVSTALRKLEQRGEVKRFEHEKDTRAKSVTLTEKGKEMVGTLVPIIEEIDSTFFGKVLIQEQISLVQILAKLTAE